MTEKTEQFITRKIEVDLGHRVMHERVKCFSIHGHRVTIALTFLFYRQADIGYNIDFKEIKRIGGSWLDDMMDHGFVANPHDEHIIKACKATKSKLYLMSLGGKDAYCNPTAENIGKEIYLAMELLFESFADLEIHAVRYYETPNCWVDTVARSITKEERKYFLAYRGPEIKTYALKKGQLEYDSRKA